MRTLPQELVDKIIDQLASQEIRLFYNIAPCSLVSRAWVTRIQQHVFEFIIFHDSEKLGRWCRKIEPDPAGVSRHTRHLIFYNIDTLTGVEKHIRAFTRVEKMEINQCNFLLLPSVAECFAPMGSSLTKLEICESPTSSCIITSMLAALPQLKDFSLEDSNISDDMDGTSLLPRIPFFEGNNSLTLNSHLDQHDPPGPPDWIPPSAQFEHLEIDTPYFLYKAVLLNQWFSHSCMTLTSLAILGDPDPPLSNQFTPLDLSPCRALAQLDLSMHLCRPGLIVETVLPSITSSQLSTISFDWEHPMEEHHHPEINYPAWEMTENHLCRLAKRFSARNPGKKMKVEIFWYCSGGPQESYFLGHVESDKFLPRLKKEVTFSLGTHG